MNNTENKKELLIQALNKRLVEHPFISFDDSIILEFVDTINNYHTEQDTALLIDLLQYGIEYKSQYSGNIIIKPQKDIIGSTTIIVCTLFWELNNH